MICIGPRRDDGRPAQQVGPDAEKDSGQAKHVLSPSGAASSGRKGVAPWPERSPAGELQRWVSGTDKRDKDWFSDRAPASPFPPRLLLHELDRKRTRLNSSH